MNLLTHNWINLEVNESSEYKTMVSFIPLVSELIDIKQGYQSD